MRHNEIRDLFATLTRQHVSNDVQTEPQLQSLSGEPLPPSSNLRDDARADIRARGFLRKGRDAFFDVTVFHPFASSHLQKDLHDLFISRSNAKKACYKARVNNVEDADFVPLVASSSGGLGPEFHKALKVIALRKSGSYSQNIFVLRVRFSFAIVCAALVCLRATRSRRSHFSEMASFPMFANAVRSNIDF
jgi:hypothetical protein